jgi:hypothetical protein
MRFWPQRDHQSMYAISALKGVVVVLGKSEGPHKCSAPCSTDVHRLARAIVVSILEKESHRQHNMEMRNEVVFIAETMENLGAESVGLLEHLGPLLRTVCSVRMCSSKCANFWGMEPRNRPERIQHAPMG